MKARPILFSGAMVRSLIAETKTQTRRIVKPQPAPHESWDWSWPVLRPGVTPGTRICWRDDVRAPNLFPYCPYGVPGDLLWVRESMQRRPGGWVYSADEADVMANRNKTLEVVSWAHHYGNRSAPSIHMPRWASRLTLEITDVRVERLQDISEADALAEGIDYANVIVGADNAGGRHREITDDRYFYGGGPDEGFTSASDAYMALWNSINGAEANFANPWVWAVSFRCINKNIDAFLKEVSDAQKTS